MFTLFHWHDGLNTIVFLCLSRLEEVPRAFPLHPCLCSSDEELRFLRCCARLLMLRLLPARDARSRSLRLLLVEVVATKGDSHWSWCTLCDIFQALGFLLVSTMTKKVQKIQKSDRMSFIHTYMHTYIHTYIHTYMHTYIHTYMHTYIHTYIHVCG